MAGHEKNLRIGVDVDQFVEDFLVGNARLGQPEDDETDPVAFVAEELHAVARVSAKVNIVSVVFEHQIENLAKSVDVGDDEDALLASQGFQVDLGSGYVLRCVIPIAIAADTTFF